MNVGLSVTDKHTSEIFFLAWSSFSPPCGYSMIPSYQRYTIILNYERGRHIVIAHIFVAFTYNSISLLEDISF